MIPLLLASIISVALTIERVLFWVRQRAALGPDEILQSVEKDGYDIALKKTRGLTPVERVLKAGMTHKDDGGASLAMETQALAEVNEMHKGLSTLDTIITLAPLMGLLGTIVGMVRSFGIISEAGLNQPHAVTGGIAEALIATAAGITVAVITLIPHNYFMSKAQRTIVDIERYATTLERALCRRKDDKECA